MNSQWISINTNSTLLVALSSQTMTDRETTSEMACNSAIIADATSGREQWWKICYIKYMCVKYPCVHM